MREAVAGLFATPGGRAVERDALRWLDASPAFPEVQEMDWDGWRTSVRVRGRGWSSGEWLVFELVLALADEAPSPLVRAFLEAPTDVWAALLLMRTP